MILLKRHQIWNQYIWIQSVVGTYYLCSLNQPAYYNRHCSSARPLSWIPATIVSCSECWLLAELSCPLLMEDQVALPCPRGYTPQPLSAQGSVSPVTELARVEEAAPLL